MNDHDKAVGELVRRRREELRLTQKEVAERVTAHGYEIADSSVANWEKGRQHLPLEKMVAVAAALEMLSPLELYAAAGLLDAVPNIPLILALSRLTEEQQRLVELLIDAVLKAENKG